ncbi:sesquipedalian [Anaeramoeba flamelloides]|uniref:Sesquipedalian n=1 Tax=Anaeramoeba flamelloides TaxID=1746091 RepID=A0ABQ8XKT2_9EUKA|nr:sesquipedalian [Anaeramoeba flamelloides]
MEKKPPKIPKPLTGYLVKQGGSHKSWKRRFFVLSDLEVYYYKKEPQKEKGSDPLGVISLFGSRVSEITRRQIKKDNAFSIFHPISRDYFCVCKNEEERVKWLHSLNKTIKYSDGLTKPLNNISLLNVNIFDADKITGLEHSISISHPLRRTFLLRAESSSKQQEWLEQIRKARVCFNHKLVEMNKIKSSQLDFLSFYVGSNRKKQILKCVKKWIQERPLFLLDFEDFCEFLNDLDQEKKMKENEKMKSRDYLKQSFNQFDLESFGTIDFRLLLTGIILMSAYKGKKKLNLIFQIFDHDSDGICSFQQILSMFTMFSHLLIDKSKTEVMAFNTQLKCQKKKKKLAYKIDIRDKIRLLSEDNTYELFRQAEKELNIESSISQEKFVQLISNFHYGISSRLEMLPYLLPFKK